MRRSIVAALMFALLFSLSAYADKEDDDGRKLAPETGSSAKANGSEREPSPTASSDSPSLREQVEECLNEPVGRDGLVFMPSGTFTEPKIPFLSLPYSRQSLDVARRLVLDEVSFFTVDTGKDKGARKNAWALPLAKENSFLSGNLDDIVPLVMEELNVSISQLKSKYGEPSHVNTFEYTSYSENMEKSFKADTVYWYGPIFVIASESDKDITKFGGFPSLLIAEDSDAAMENIKNRLSLLETLPPFKKSLTERLMFMRARGNPVHIENPNPFGVLAGIRSGDNGINLYIAPNHKNSVNVPKGKYDIYFVYSNTPDALYQGNNFILYPGQRLDILIDETVGGNYDIRRVK